MSITLNVEVIGLKEATDIYNTEEISIVGKTEIELNALVVSDSWQSIPVSKIGTISKIIANVTTESTTVLPSANIRIIYSGNPSGITIPINGIFVYSVGDVFTNLITDIDVSTDSTTEMNCVVSVYGV